MREFINKYYKIVIGIIAIFIFSTILLNVVKDTIEAFDTIGYKYIYEGLKNEILINIFIVITTFVSPITIIGFIIVSFIIFKNKKIPKLILLNAVLITTINQLLKQIISRPRPEYGLIEEGGFSFPSGHSMVSFAFYGFLIYLLFIKMRNKRKKTILISLLCILIVLIGVSRIYLGVHYISDVLGGFSISLVYLLIYTSFTNKILLKEKKK